MYYDPRKNEYIVPSNDTVEGFSDQELSEEEEGHVLVHGGNIISYKDGGDFTTLDPDNPESTLPNTLHFPGDVKPVGDTGTQGAAQVQGGGGVEHFVDSPAGGADSSGADSGGGGASSGGGASGGSSGGGSSVPPFAGAQKPITPRTPTYGPPIKSCYDGDTYNSQMASGDPSSKIDSYKTACNADVACKGFTTIKDYPKKGQHMVQFKNRIDQGGFPVTPDPNTNCQTYVAKIPDTSSVTQLQHNITAVANPALPVQQGSQLDFTNLAQWSGPSTVEVSASNVNKNWPGGGATGKWSWDADTLPKDTNYYMVDGSARDQQVIGLPHDCKDSKLNPERASIIKDPSNPSNLFVYVDGRKMAVKQDTGPGGGNMCYTAAYWANPSVRNTCEVGGTDPTKNYDSSQANDCTKAADVSKIPSKTVTQKCFDAIPSIQGSGPGHMGNLTAVNCKSDVRPSDRIRIVNQVSKEANMWSNRGRKNAMLYNAKTEIASSKYDTIQKSNSLLRKQVGNSQSNSMKLDKLNNSIYSQQRQVEVANDETRRRNENLFLLKLLLTYCLVVSIPLMLKKIFGGKIKNSYILLILVFITIPFIYILGSNLYAIRNRSPMRWPLRNFPTGPLPPDDDLYEEEMAPTCPPQKHEVQAAEEEAMAIQEEIDDLQRKIHRCEVKEEAWKKQLNEDQTRLCTVNEKIPGKSCHSASGSFTI